MAEHRSRALSEVLDQLEDAAADDAIAIQKILERLGPRSFASVMLVFSLISTSPASTIPGITATVAIIVCLLAVQMLAGRQCVWLPDVIARRRISTAKLCKGISWLRRPTEFVERFLWPRHTYLLRRPWIFLPLISIIGLTLTMPFMELIPTSGSAASAIIALFSAGILTRDGALVIVSMFLLLSGPIAVWYFGFTG
ncbi:MAG: exopolysaccharide biosynthesis protein [Hyphomicrobium sp.]|nr:exopolysaccharide biosynthesis protein [Hyphomicrobium sp.]